MGTLAKAGDVVLIDEIVGDAALQLCLRALRIGEGIDLDAGGTFGRWERTVARRADGSTAEAIRPVGPTQDAWRELRAQGTGPVEIHVLADDIGLAGFGQRFLIWDLPENQIR